ncbi:hypothetical protein K1719_017160 [Acacia pycnantha]|nr:hypothetical protein K1719_017160 [Acacia pycnantha]
MASSTRKSPFATATNKRIQIAVLQIATLDFDTHESTGLFKNVEISASFRRASGVLAIWTNGIDTNHDFFDVCGLVVCQGKPIVSHVWR